MHKAKVNRRRGKDMFGFSAFIFTVLSTVKGCSLPDGGFVEPTAAKIVFYADYVVIGRVRYLVTPDPVYGDIHESIYGAQLQLSCQYKGGDIPKIITVIGAGFIPGHCTTKELKYDTEYILFLSKRDSGHFEQTFTAYNTTELGKFLQVCNLTLKYPVGINQDDLNVRCQAPKNSSDCERYDQSADTLVSPSPSLEPVVSASPEHFPNVENVQVPEKGAAQMGQITTTPASGSGAIHYYAFLLVFVMVLLALVLL